MAAVQDAFDMKPTNLLQLIIIITMLSVFFYLACQNQKEYSVKNNKESFRDKPVFYTKHAKCVMNCKNISEDEIQELIINGKLNVKESFPKDKPCPTFAIEGFTNDSQQVRVIVGECSGTSRVITVIDLGKERMCNCW